MESYGEWRVNGFGELRLLRRQKYSNSPFIVTKQFLITISDKHRNSPAVNI